MSTYLQKFQDSRRLRWIKSVGNHPAYFEAGYSYGDDDEILIFVQSKAHVAERIALAQKHGFPWRDYRTQYWTCIDRTEFTSDTVEILEMRIVLFLFHEQGFENGELWDDDQASILSYFESEKREVTQ